MTVAAASERIAAALKIAAWHVMRHLPAEWVSAFGGAFVRWSVPRHRPAVLAGARTNLRRHRPHARDDEIDRMAMRFLDNVGRVMAEFAVLHRVVGEGRVTIDPEFRRFMADLKGPAIWISLHTGNWEVAAALPRPGVKLASIAVVPESAADRAVAARVRRSMGCEIFPADRTGLRRAMRWLEHGEGPRVLGIHCDEARAGRLMGPLFGRPAHGAGNLALAARLARRMQAPILGCHVVRTGGCRFRAVAFSVPPLADGASLDQDVSILNGAIEPVIRAHLEQWYFLDNPF